MYYRGAAAAIVVYDITKKVLRAHHTTLPPHHTTPHHTTPHHTTPHHTTPHHTTSHHITPHYSEPRAARGGGSGGRHGRVGLVSRGGQSGWRRAACILRQERATVHQEAQVGREHSVNAVPHSFIRSFVHSFLCAVQPKPTQLRASDDYEKQQKLLLTRAELVNVALAGKIGRAKNMAIC